MTTPHSHLDANASLEKIRAVSKAWEAGTGISTLETWEAVGQEFRALDRHLCNGGGLPDDWSGYYDRKPPKSLAEKVRPGELVVDYGHGDCCPHTYRLVDEMTGLWERRGQTMPQPGNPEYTPEEGPTA